MATLDAYAGDAVGLSGSWANFPNAYGSTSGNYAVLTGTTASAVYTAELRAFGLDTALPNGAVVSALDITVRCLVSDTTRISSLAGAAFLGGVQIGSTATLTKSTAATETTFNVSGLELTKADAAALAVQFSATWWIQSTSRTVSLDWVRVTATYDIVSSGPEPGRFLLST